MTGATIPSIVHIFRDSRLSDVESEFQEFTMDPGYAPERIFVSHMPDKRPYFSVDFQTADAIARLPAPEKPETGTMPSDQGLRLDDLYGVEYRWEQAIENNKKPTIGICQSSRAFILRRKTFSCFLSAVFSASSRHMGLNCAVNRASSKRNRAIMARA